MAGQLEHLLLAAAGGFQTVALVGFIAPLAVTLLGEQAATLQHTLYVHGLRQNHMHALLNSKCLYTVTQDNL